MKKNTIRPFTGYPPARGGAARRLLQRLRRGGAVEPSGRGIKSGSIWKPRLTEELLIKRNNSWMPKILASLPKEPCFIAVGALHLFGREGLIRQLTAEGYTLTPLVTSVYQR